MSFNIFDLLYTLLLIIWIFCFAMALNNDASKKNTTIKKFRIDKRIISIFLLVLSIIAQIISSAWIDNIVGIMIMIISIMLIIASAIIPFFNKKQKN